MTITDYPTSNAEVERAVRIIRNELPSGIALPIVERLRKHMHSAGTLVGKHIDTCAECGADLRDAVHVRVGESR